MNEHDKQQLFSLLQRMRELAIESNKGLGISQLDEFERLESIRFSLENEINEFKDKTNRK